MMSLKNTALIFISLHVAIFLSVKGYPISTEKNLLNKNEKKYPNGTVIGKYTYMDDDGNPIQVKYFADQANYGVELKSVKVVNSNSDSSQLEKDLKFPLRMTDNPFELTLDPFSAFKDLAFLNKNFTHDLFHPFDAKSRKTQKEHLKQNAEYEIFTQNELKTPEKCGKEKVKIYFDKDKRKTRKTGQYESLEYCNRD